MALDLEKVRSFVEGRIGTFHQRRLESLERLRLSTLLKNKNPYLFRAKNVLTGHELVKSLLDAHLSSQEEGIFGEFLEELAIYVCELAHGGVKSGADGIDLEFVRDGVRYIVAVKSGPNWGNSRQVAKMQDDFRKYKRIANTSGARTIIQSINGCCYGQDNRPDKGDYFKYCGQEFWEFISGDSRLYIDIVEPLGYRAKERNEEFAVAYARIINRFTEEFLAEYSKSGEIDWEKLVAFNSGVKIQTRRSAPARPPKTGEPNE